MSNNEDGGNNWGDIYVNQKLRVRIQSNRIYNEKETPIICYGIFIRNPGRKLHVRESNIPLRSKYDKPLCRNKIRERGCRDSMDEPLSNPVNKYSTTPVHERVV